VVTQLDLSPCLWRVRWQSGFRILQGRYADVREGIAGRSFGIWGGIVRGLVGVHVLSSRHVGVTQTIAR
jgi:hypothetical protein